MLLNCVVLEKTFESPLDCKEIQPVHPKENQSWMFIGRTDVETETPILWPPDAKRWLIWKDPDAGKDWRQEGKGMAEYEMASLTKWTWIWANSGSWWWTGRPGMLQSMRSQRVRHELVTELNWTATQAYYPQAVVHSSDLLWDKSSPGFLMMNWLLCVISPSRESCINNKLI